MSDTIWVYTKERHLAKLSAFLTDCGLNFQLFTQADSLPANTPCTPAHCRLGVSYCYPRLIPPALLAVPDFGFINYHPGPLPQYPGPQETTIAVTDAQTLWGVTAHYMDEIFDHGPVIQRLMFRLHEPPVAPEELSALSHWFLFHLFRLTIRRFSAERARPAEAHPAPPVHYLNDIMAGEWAQHIAG